MRTKLLTWRCGALCDAVLQDFVEPFDLLFLPLAIANVAEKCAEQPRVREADRRDGELHRELAPIMMERRQLDAIAEHGRRPGREELRQGAVVCGVVLGGDDDVGGQPSLHGRGGPTEHGFGAGVPVADHTCGIHGDHGVQGEFDDGVPAPLGGTQLQPRALALDRVADRSSQDGAVHLSLDEEILRPLLYHPNRETIVAQAREHDDGHVGGQVGDCGKRPVALAVGQREIDEHDVDRRVPETRERALEPIHPLHRVRGGRDVAQQLENQSGVPGIVFDEEHLDRVCSHVGRHGRFGTSVSSTSRTLRANASSVNGFCRKGMPASSTPWRTMPSSV
jgi:hypothetical protein